MPDQPFNPAILVPVYNHGKPFQDLARKLRTFDLPILIVDDGSEDETREILREMDRTYSSVHTLRKDNNGGKGAAVKTGLNAANQFGYSHVLQIDADDQHDPTDIPSLLDKSRSHPESLVLAVPRFDESIPVHRFYSRYLTHIWTWFETLSFDIPDALCGYRVYPVQRTLEVFQKYAFGNRMEFDPGITIRFYWDGGDIQSVPTNVTYHEDVDSNYNLVADTVRISWMHCRCVFGMLYRFPELIRRTGGSYPPTEGADRTSSPD